MELFNILTFFIILSSLIKLSFQYTYIVFPFKTSTKGYKTYPDNLLQNDLEITLNIGNPPQSIDLNLRSKAYSFFVTSVQANLPYKTFNESKSGTLIKENEKPDTYRNQEYSKAFKIYDSIYIDNREIKNISLLLATSLEYQETGALGLRLVDEHEYIGDLSFILQIKKKFNLYNYTYMINYKNDNEGDLIIGAYPHIYDKNSFNQDNFKYAKAGILNGNVDWIIDFDVIRYDNNTIPSMNFRGFTQIEFGLIQAPSRLKKHLNNTFFKNQCTEKFNIKRTITILHCKENFKISDFKNISFILKDSNLEFTLTYKDLFIKENNEYIFGIVFDETGNKDTPWILGKPFIKKYSLIYDLDKKTIGTYKGKNLKNEEPKNPHKVLIILIIIFSIIIIGLVIFIVYYVKKPKKRNLAKELNDDNYEYFPTD